WKTRRGEIVGQRVEPDVCRLRFAGGERRGEGHAPRQPRAAGREILESLIEQREHLVAARLRLHELGALRDQPPEKALVLAEAEEPVALLHPLERARGMQHTLSVDDLGILLERLAADAIPPAVRLLVEIVGVVVEDALDQRADA